MLEDLGVANNSIVNLGDLTKPADTLIKKISEAVGGLFKAKQIVRVAKAEAEAAVIMAAANIEIDEMQRRALQRLIVEEGRKQANIEGIVAMALSQVSEDAQPETMDDDWVANFFEKCRLISNEEMQALWARILAGEANSPGSFSKRTIELLSSLDKKDAETFLSLRRFCWDIGGLTPLIYEYGLQARFYGPAGITFETLTHLEAIGLIHFSVSANYVRQNIPQYFTFEYGDRAIEMSLPLENDNSVHTGLAILTRAGQELASVCAFTPDDEFCRYIQEKWRSAGITPGAKPPTQD